MNRWLLTKIAQRARQICRRYRLTICNRNLILLMTYFVLHVRIEDDSQNLKKRQQAKGRASVSGSERKVNMVQERKDDDEVQKWKESREI